jgi:hypothetical protein
MPQELRLDGATVYMMTRDAIKAKVGLAWHADKLKSMSLRGSVGHPMLGRSQIRCHTATYRVTVPLLVI